MAMPTSAGNALNQLIAAATGAVCSKDADCVTMLNAVTPGSGTGACCYFTKITVNPVTAASPATAAQTTTLNAQTALGWSATSSGAYSCQSQAAW